MKKLILRIIKQFKRKYIPNSKHILDFSKSRDIKKTNSCVIARAKPEAIPEIASLSRNCGTPRNDVVMIDRDGGIRLSDAVDSRRKPAPRGAAFRPLSSVISVNPAQILREDLPNSLPVALSGTVPCRAATENGQWTVDYGLKRGKYGI